MTWKPQRLTFETTLDFDDEQDVPVIIEVRPITDEEWELIEVNKADDGSQLILTSDLNSAITNYVNDHIGEAIGDAEGDYADYRYEQWRDERMMEDHYGDR
jgi:hypothetical protein